MRIGQLNGIERVIAQLTADIYTNMEKYEAVPTTIEACKITQKIIQDATIGQLLTLSNLGDRWKGFKLLGKDDEMIALEINGCYGGMTPDGRINT